MPHRFDKFTERARRVLELAQSEAARLNHNYIGTEHLLLGLVHEEEGIAARALAKLGVDLTKVRNAVEVIVGRGDPAVQHGDIGLTPRAKRSIEFAVDEARQLSHHYIGTEHLLLGLAREGEGVAVGVLASLGVGLEALRAEVADAMIGASLHSGTTRQALEQARLSARWYGREHADPEDLLLGLVRQRTGLAAQLLAELGLDRRRLQSALDETAPASRGEPNAPDFSARATAAIDNARSEAQQRSQTRVTTAHLLLALLNAPDSPAPALLQRLGLDVEAVRGALDVRLASAED